MNLLSLTTTYIETFFFRADNGQSQLRSYATGFFVREPNRLFLVTNWHVLTGLDPATPASATLSPPNYMKLSLLSKKRRLVELTMPLYDESMNPLWREHKQRYEVDIAVYPLPLSLAQYFQMLDIRTMADNADIEEVVAKDVFLLGYPFSKRDMESSFGNDTPYYLPVWKRGTIASEPSLRLGERVILIDALSRPGMSGAPVLVSEEREVLRMEGENAEIWSRREQGTLNPVGAISLLNTSRMPRGTERQFKLLGVYSGVIGSTRLEQVALGKCWHVDTLQEMIASNLPGVMPHHAPLPNDFYRHFLSELGTGRLITRNAAGQIVDTVSLS